MLIPVVLSGGVGSRLWPLSREGFPKQFQPLASEQSMLLDTLGRLDGLPELAAPIMVCNEAHRFLVAQQLQDARCDRAHILLEPVGRNTAPAVAAAALQARAMSDDALLLVLPADHVIADREAFQAAVTKGQPLAQQGKLVTFGIVPTRAETGYGYINQGASLAESAFELKRFVEKPDPETAQSYVDSGEYLWNSGMFLLSAKAYLDELAAHAPAIYEASVAAFEAAARDLDFIRLGEAEFSASPSDSIDYAVMEHTQNGAVVALDCGWNDVGAWSALWDVAEKDADGNVVSGDVMCEAVSNSYLRSETRLVAGLGLDNLVVVETADAVLVADRDRVQDVKAIVSRLKSEGRDEANVHSRVYRPWGSYESLVTAGRFQVKRIVVNPGQTLSLQMHHHRAEHWIVVQGTAEVTCDERVFILAEDESTYIPLGKRHRLANPGVIPLELIEVQTGSYLGEDDIVRFEDVYGRTPEAQS